MGGGGAWGEGETLAGVVVHGYHQPPREGFHAQKALKQVRDCQPLTYLQWMDKGAA